MERNIQKKGIVNLLMLLLAGVAGFAVARLCDSAAGQVCALYLGLGTLVAAVSWFQMRLEEGERLERLELEELSRGRSTSALFEAKDAEAFPARRSREQFERYFVPGFTLALFFAQAAGAYLLWRWVSRNMAHAELKVPTTGMMFFSLSFLLLFVLGRFSSSYARLEGQRLLRPGASYLLLDAFICLAVAGGMVGVWLGYAKTDFYLAQVLCGMLGLIAVETLVTLVLEIYRPRVKGKVERPLYESRLVGLLGQPEGLITTAAQAIDYQFGFKVSETWFYKFFIQAALWLVPLQLGALLLSTCFVVIEPGEQGLLERFGKPVEGRTVLESGPHLTCPWPIDRVYRHRTQQIQNFDVGFTPGSEKEEESIVLWTVAHTQEENFLVANREQSSEETTNKATTARTPPVSLLTVSIPVQYQITNLVDWAYRNADAGELLQDLGTREVVRYLAGADLSQIMSVGRQEASQRLVEQMQAAANEHQLGVRVVSVGLQDLHPPVKVAPDYEKVIGATYTRQAKVLAARAKEIRTNELSTAAATVLINQARAAQAARQSSALAQAGLFTNQIPAFEAAPAVYAERAYLRTFARATANARKYILLTTNTHDVLTFDLQESAAQDLLRLKAPEPKAK